MQYALVHVVGTIFFHVHLRLHPYMNRAHTPLAAEARGGGNIDLNNMTFRLINIDFYLMAHGLGTRSVAVCCHSNLCVCLPRRHAVRQRLRRTPFELFRNVCLLMCFVVVYCAALLQCHVRQADLSVLRITSERVRCAVHTQTTLFPQ